MVTAIILECRTRSHSGRHNEVLKIDGIMEVHSVAGEYDLAAIARVDDNQQLSMILADKMCHQIKGITHTKTLISLGSYYNFEPKRCSRRPPSILNGEKKAKAPLPESLLFYG